MLPKIRMMSKISSNKSCSELNFIQKSQWAHIFLKREARGLERLIRLKYYNKEKWQITFTLWLNTAKNIDHIEKSFE